MSRKKKLTKEEKERRLIIYLKKQGLTEKEITKKDEWYNLRQGTWNKRQYRGIKTCLYFWIYEVLKKSNNIITYDLLSGTFSEETAEDENGKYISQKLDMTFAKITEEMNVQLDEMLSGIFRVIVLDNNGNYNMLGLYNGIELTNGSVTIGSEKED